MIRPGIYTRIIHLTGSKDNRIFYFIFKSIELNGNNRCEINRLQEWKSSASHALTVTTRQDDSDKVGFA